MPFAFVVPFDSNAVAYNSSGQLSLRQNCATNEILKWNGSQWTCSVDATSGGGLAPGSVGSTELGTNSVVTAKIADAAVTSTKIAASGVATANIADGAVSAAKIAACGINQILQYNGTAWACTAPAVGSVTNVATGAGLTGGPIVTSGTIAVDVGTTANKILQLDSSAKISAVNGSLVTNITAANITGQVATAQIADGAVTPGKLAACASGETLHYNGTAWVCVGGLPVGSMVDFAGTTVPAGWLMCDGAAVSRTTYSNLFAAIGTAYGAGNGSTTFNVPDYRGRFARYNDNMGSGAASRDSGRVHGSSQGQATAKNGLQNASSAISGTANSGVDLSHTHNSSIPKAGASGVVAGTSNFMTSNTNHSPWQDVTSSASGSLDHSHTLTGTADAQTITGDTETRPINLSSNRIIKY